MDKILECIEQVAKDKKLSKEFTKEFKRDVEKYGFDKAFEDAEYRLNQRNREFMVNTVRARTIWNTASEHPKGLKAGIMQFLVRDPYQYFDVINVDGYANLLQGQYHSVMREFLDAGRNDWIVGLKQDKDMLRKFVHAVYGETVEGDVGKFAKQYNELGDLMRSDYLKAGGMINKKEDWNLPNSHNREVIANTPKQQWIDDTIPMLDQDKMMLKLDIEPDEYETAIREALDVAYESITKNGINKTQFLELAPKGIGQSLAGRHSEQRFLEFKTADTWLAYNEKYGDNDVFSTVNSHIESMAATTAQMKVLGANPEMVLDAVIREGIKSNGLTAGQANDLKAQLRSVNGDINDPVNVGLAKFAQGVRNLISAATLHRAILSATADVGMGAITRSVNGLSPINALTAGLSGKDKILAGVEIGLGADAFVSASTASNRFGDTYGLGWTAKVSEAVIRSQGLARWTEGSRKAFGTEFSMAMATQFGKSFNELPVKMRKAMQSYGIEEADWISFSKSSNIKTIKGARLADLKQNDKFLNMVLSETDYAVPTPDARTRRFQTGGLKSGTVTGEVTRSLMQLKSFPVTMMTTHLARMMYRGDMRDRITYGGMLIGASLVFGSTAMWAKDIAAGREPRPIGDNPEDISKFMAAAMAQGGGLGILGDLAFSDANRFGKGLVSSLAGASVGFGDDFLKLTVGNLQQAMKGEEMNLQGELTSFAYRTMPKPFMSGIVLERAMDSLAAWGNPEQQKKLQRSMRKRQQDYGQDFWWRKGELLPEAMQ